MRARWRFEDLQCDSPVDCRSRDRCRIACIKSIWQFAGLQAALRPRARLQYFCSAKMQTNASGSPKSSREAAFLRARWRFEDLQCDSPVDCRSRDRCRIACIKSIWQFAGLQTALRPRARLQYFCSAKMQTNASGSPKNSEISRFPNFFFYFLW